MESTRSSEGDLAAARYRDLHRSRSSNAPRKRTRFAPARPNSTSSTISLNTSNIINSSNRPPQHPSNGRSSGQHVANGMPRLRSTPSPMQHHPEQPNAHNPPNVLVKIARAQRAADSRTKPDPRFIPGQRAIECLSTLKSSIAVSLFDNGFVRHDHFLTHASGVNATGGNEILSHTRYAYDAGSQHFLTALECGTIPASEDEYIEPCPKRTFYDGCIVAEIFDFRGVRDQVITACGENWRKCAWFQRVLLRPDACYHAIEIHEQTKLVGDGPATLFESRLLLAQNPVLDLDPTPRLHCSTANITKNAICALPNASHSPRRKRRRERIGDVPPRPPVSMSALLLIDAAEKNQTRALLKAKETATKPAPMSQEVAQLPELLRGSGDSSAILAAPVLSTSQKARASGLPPLRLFQKANERFPPTRSPTYSTTGKKHERLRTIRLLFADRNSSHIIRTTRAAQALGTATPQQVQVMHKTLTGLNRKGQQVCVLELVSRPARGCDVALFRGMIGDKARDVNKIELSTVEEANDFLDQFKRILEREGYICIHDGDPHKVQAHAAQQASAISARQRAMQAAAAAANGQVPLQVAAAAAAGLSPAQRMQHAQQRAAAAASAQVQARNAAQFSSQHAALRRAGVLQQAQQFQHQQRQAYASSMTQQQQLAAAAKQQAQFGSMLPMSPVNAMRVQQQQAQGVQAVPHGLTPVEAMRARQAQHAHLIEHQARLHARPSEPIPASAIAANAIPPSMLTLPQQTPTGNTTGGVASAPNAATGTGDTGSQRSRGSGSRGSRKR